MCWVFCLNSHSAPHRGYGKSLAISADLRKPSRVGGTHTEQTCTLARTSPHTLLSSIHLRCRRVEIDKWSELSSEGRDDKDQSKRRREGKESAFIGEEAGKEKGGRHPREG